jgi:perosamine synthetase
VTFAATANAILYQGGTPVFADVRSDTLTLSVDEVERTMTTRTRAVIVVDYAGTPVDLDRFRALADARSVTLIEDASHALGARSDGRPVGSLADLTTFSLHPVKHVTTGEGGIVTTGSVDAAARMRSFRNHGITSDHRQRTKTGAWQYDMVDLGFNYRLSDIQCALGLSQLRKLPTWVDRRRTLAGFYDEAFRQVPEIETLVVPRGSEPAWHIYPIRLRLECLRVDRGQIFRALRAENIGVNVHYIPVPWHPYYQRLGYRRGSWPIAESEYERLLTLPLFPSMSDADAADVVEAVAKVVAYYKR